MSARLAAFSSIALLAACGKGFAEGPSSPPETASGAAVTAGRDIEALQRDLLAQQEPFFLEVVATLGGISWVGVACDAPLPMSYRRGEGLMGDGYSISDVVGEFDQQAFDVWEDRAEARNLRTIDRPDFPYPDVCRPFAPGEHRPVLPGRAHALAFLNGTAPARVVSGPARDLHDAARRGTPAEIRRWAMEGVPLDTPDAFGRTPLAWAVVRNRSDAVATLLELGADPDAGLPRPISARLLAARLGREDMFAAMAVRKESGGAPPYHLMEAAVAGGGPRIVRRLVEGGVENVSFTRLMLRSIEQGDPEIRDILLEAGGAEARDGLLLAAVTKGDLPALEQALHSGADPDAAEDCRRSGLQLAATGEPPNSDIITRRLLEEGADVDANVVDDPTLADPCLTPLAILIARAWRTVDESVRERRLRQDRILTHLLRAGPDLTVLGEDRQPLIALAVAGPHMNERRWVDGVNPGTPILPDEWMRALIAAGMDVNAEWGGRRVLDWAIEVHGPNSETVRRLRSYGARD